MNYIFISLKLSALLKRILYFILKFNKILFLKLYSGLRTIIYYIIILLLISL